MTTVEDMTEINLIPSSESHLRITEISLYNVDCGLRCYALSPLATLQQYYIHNLPSAICHCITTQLIPKSSANSYRRELLHTTKLGIWEVDTDSLTLNGCGLLQVDGGQIQKIR
jgi:hypothetical protein